MSTHELSPALRSIRTAIVALVLAVLAHLMLSGNEGALGLPLFFAALLIALYSFVPTFLHSLRSG